MEKLINEFNWNGFGISNVYTDSVNYASINIDKIYNSNLEVICNNGIILDIELIDQDGDLYNNEIVLTSIKEILEININNNFGLTPAGVMLLLLIGENLWEN